MPIVLLFAASLNETRDMVIQNPRKQFPFIPPCKVALRKLYCSAAHGCEAELRKGFCEWDFALSHLSYSQKVCAFSFRVVQFLQPFSLPILISKQILAE